MLSKPDYLQTSGLTLIHVPDDDRFKIVRVAGDQSSWTWAAATHELVKWVLSENDNLSLYFPERQLLVQYAQFAANARWCGNAVQTQLPELVPTSWDQMGEKKASETKAAEEEKAAKNKAAAEEKAAKNKAAEEEKAAEEKAAEEENAAEEKAARKAEKKAANPRILEGVSRIGGRTDRRGANVFDTVFLG